MQDLVHSKIGAGDFRSWRTSFEYKREMQRAKFEKFNQAMIGDILIKYDAARIMEGVPIITVDGQDLAGIEHINKRILHYRPNTAPNACYNVYWYLCRTAPQCELPPYPYASFINGDLNLQTLELLKPNRSRPRVNIIPHRWVEGASNDLLMRTLARVACMDLVTITQILEMIGACLAMQAPPSQPKMFLLVGSGSNGKSVVVSLLQNILGLSNISIVPPQTLAKRFQSVALMGKLANIDADISGDSVDADSCAMIKTVVAGDLSPMEFKGKETTFFRPYSTLVYGCNNVPLFKDTSPGFNRRVQAIPFNAVFTVNDADYNPHISRDLACEEVIEAAIYSGALAYSKVLQAGDFTVSEKSAELKEEIEINNDNVKGFLEDEYPDGAGLEGQVVPLVYEQYKGWCIANGCTPAKGRKMAKRLKEVTGLHTKKKWLNGSTKVVYTSESDEQGQA